MLHDSAAPRGTAEDEASAAAGDQRTRATPIDLRAVSGARRGFEGLMISRGRHHHRQPASAQATERHAQATAARSRSTAFHVGIAESREQFEAAHRLISRRYAWRGYSTDSFDVHAPHARADESRHEITFFAGDAGAIHGTITLRLDGPKGLVAETTHRDAMRHARARGGRIAELTRLAVAEAAESRLVLASLFALVYAVGRFVHDVTDVFIEVNPRHVAFYSRALGFAVAGETRFCERVGAPSVLLHLDVAVLDDRLGFAHVDVPDEILYHYGT